jgi:hypothetical protein
MNRVGYESAEVNTTVVLWFVAGLVVTVVIVQLVTYWLQLSLEASRIGPLLGPPPGPPAATVTECLRLQSEPPLQGTPDYMNYGAAEVTAIRQAEEKLLDSYGWVDRPRGIVHIPIERAMQLLSVRGLPTSRNPKEGEP